MANTGYKQAVIAFKVSKPGGEPLDVNGQLTRVSGRKQAIALLQGHVNPNASLYEVEYYFNREGAITGNPTISYDVVSCPIGYIRATPTRIILDPETPTANIILDSSSSWRMISGPTRYVNINYTSGAAGTYLITLTRTSFVGQGYFTFKNEATLQTVTVYAANVVSKPWVLDKRYGPMIAQQSDLNDIFAAKNGYQLIDGALSITTPSPVISWDGITVNASLLECTPLASPRVPWFIIGYENANSFCAIGGREFPGQIVNVNLADQTYTVVKSTAITPKEGKLTIAWDGDNFTDTREDGTVMLSYSQSDLLSLGAKVQNKAIGVTFFNVNGVSLNKGPIVIDLKIINSQSQYRGYWNMLGFWYDSGIWNY